MCYKSQKGVTGHRYSFITIKGIARREEDLTGGEKTAYEEGVCRRPIDRGIKLGQ